MKKTLIALAVAGAIASPAFAATSNVDVYGVMHFAIEDTNVTNSDAAVVDRVSRIGFKGSEDLGGGLSAIWQIEQQINATADSGAGATIDPDHKSAFGGAGLRNTYVGLKGGFGTVLMGRHDTPYKMATGKYDLFTDTAADYNGGVGITVNISGTTSTTFSSTGVIDNNHDYRSPQTIAYVSPNFSGMSFAAAAVATNSASNLDDSRSIDAFSLSGNYDNGPISVAAAYQDVKALDSKAWKIGGGYAFGNLKVGALYENAEFLDGDLDVTGYQLNAAYAMGAITLKANYGKKKFDLSGVGDDDGRQWTVGADYNLSKRTVAYMLYTKADTVTADVTVGTAAISAAVSSKDVGTFAIGIKHSF